MTCGCAEPKDCCKDCQDPPEPVLPKCNISLPDGRYTNATVVVENGCIIALENGRIPQYTPQVCCGGGGGGGGGGEGEQGEKGDPGENATIGIGEVSTLAPGSKAYVRNDGTDTNAVLSFGIPAGQQGESGVNPGGVTNAKGGISIDNGNITALPAAWPPVLYIVGQTDNVLINLKFSDPDESTGLVNATLNLGPYDSDLREWVEKQITDTVTPIQNDLNDAIRRIVTLEAQVASLDTRVTTLERRNP